MTCDEAQELITGLVDDELSRQESSLIKPHLADCPTCQRTYSLEQALKGRLRDAAMSIRAPSELREKILRDQRRSQRKAWFPELWQKLPRISSVVAQTAVVVALFILPVLFARYWLQSPYFPIVPGIFQSYRQIAQGEIIPTETSDMTELKERLRLSVKGKFAPMAYDFSMMDLQLVGGLVQEIANRPVLVTVYRGNGSALICYTFLGSEEDAPEIAEVMFDPEKRMNFYQFFHAGTNAVMHREGQVICILVSPMPKEELLALARAKAHPRSVI